MPQVLHNIPPLYDARSQTLILGSFPSIQSRAGAFFYHHPQNRFWRVLSAVYGCETPVTIQEKRDMLHREHIALWDVVASCDIQSSADSTIRNVTPNDLSRILDAAPIAHIVANGNTAHDLYTRYCLPLTGRPAVKLPSTSSANAAYSLERLIDCWQILRK